MSRFTYYREHENTEPILCSVSYAKKQIRAKGGAAWTEHYDRDGSFQESTSITLGNNADTTYRAKYNTSKCYK